jgi:CarboxypepD_reg-like domain
MKCPILISFLLCLQSANGQFNIRGRVINKETKEPLASISVYLNNTSIGTTTDKQGIFILRGIPAEKFRLVASGIGFETFIKLVDSKEIVGEIEISLKPKPEELKGLEVLPPDPDGWAKWGELFIKIFIGNSPNSDNCHIENPEILKFRLDTDNWLTVYAREPLHIRNYSLGYEITYKLEEFEFNLSSKIVDYDGYAFFKDLSPSFPKSAKKWQEARADTYQGSLLHFMRAFFINSLEPEGFEMRSLSYISNPIKDSAKKLFALHKDSVILDTTFNSVTPGAVPNTFQVTLLTNNVSDKYKAALSESDSIISRQLIPADSIGFMVDSSTAGLYFPDSLEVSYKLKNVPTRYKRISKTHKNETIPISQFVFLNKKPVYVLSNGYYYGPHDLKITGFWAWWETIANMLPFNYNLTNK